MAETANKDPLTRKIYESYSCLPQAADQLDEFGGSWLSQCPQSNRLEQELSGGGPPRGESFLKPRQAGVLSRLGVRGRLLLAFFAVSAFAVLGAAAAFYSFQEFGDALGLITQRRTPAALKSQEFARHAERIVAAAPALLTAASQAEKDERA